MLRLRITATLVLGVILAISLPIRADRRDQKAADLYEEARDLIGKKKYREGIAKLNQCLARGATEPTDTQGSETRYMAERYDPYYWLGVAQMELGMNEQALTNFQKSESAGWVVKWKKEWADLQRRRDVLLARLEAPLPVKPTAVLAAAPPTATPVVVAALVPTRPLAAIAPTPTPFALRLPTVAAAPPTPAISREAELRALLRGGLEALARGDWAGVEKSVEQARKSDPKAPQPDLILCAALSSRYILGGKRDASTLEAAKRSLAAWRGKLGKGRPLPPILSPAMREVLQ